jgi:arabinofuranosyltransferase
VVNERVCYQEHTALVFNLRGTLYKTHPYYEDGVKLRRDGTKVATKGAAGMTGFASGPGFHLVNEYALTDPLLARIQHQSGKGWRIGHFYRHLPAGYLETLERGTNVIEDPCIQEFYDHLRLVTRGPVFSGKRLATVFSMNFGAYNHLLRPDCAARRSEGQGPAKPQKGRK